MNEIKLPNELPNCPKCLNPTKLVPIINYVQVQLNYNVNPDFGIAQTLKWKCPRCEYIVK